MSKKQTKTEKAKFFGVSLTTLANWARGGAPVEADIGDMATWKADRDLTRAGLGYVFPRLPGLVGELTRRRADLADRVRMANEMPEDAAGQVKAPVLWSLILEEAILALPEKFLAMTRPEAVPEDIHRAVLDTLDELRRESRTMT